MSNGKQVLEAGFEEEFLGEENLPGDALPFGSGSYNRKHYKEGKRDATRGAGSASHRLELWTHSWRVATITPGA
jgi:hypothetical protein